MIKRKRETKQSTDKVIDIIGFALPLFIFLFTFLVPPIYQCGEIPIYKSSSHFIDMKSIYKEQYQKSKTYTFWTKDINEQDYILTEINIDCSNRSWATKNWLKYKKGGGLIESKKNNYYMYYRDSIVPHSITMAYYEIVCQPHTRFIYKLESRYPFFRGKLPILEVGY